MMGSSQGVKDKPFPIPAWCLGHPHLPAGSVLSLLHFAFYPLVCALGLIQLPEMWGHKAKKEQKITPEWGFHYQESCFPGNTKFLWCGCSWVALPCPEMPFLGCWEGECCPQATKNTSVGPDLGWEAKGWAGTAVGGLLFFFNLELFFLSWVQLCPIPPCHFEPTLLQVPAMGHTCQTCGKTLCQPIGRGPADATHGAGWRPKELASSAFPHAISKCQSCTKTHPALQSQWHSSD